MPRWAAPSLAGGRCGSMNANSSAVKSLAHLLPFRSYFARVVGDHMCSSSGCCNPLESHKSLPRNLFETASEPAKRSEGPSMNTGLIIAGFHRSGTSSVAQHLSASGLFIGDDLVGSAPSNPHGHFEDWEVVRFHDAALKSAELDWASVTFDELALDFQSRSWLSEFVTRRQAGRMPWGFKDPRVCQFLEHWKRACPGVRVLIVFRNPAECAHSLQRRHASEFPNEERWKEINARFFQDADHALKLWLSHNTKLVDFARKHLDDCLVVGHASFKAGLSLGEALNTRFDMGLELTPVERTFDRKLMRQAREPLFVVDRTVLEKVRRVWRDLCALQGDTIASAPAVEDLPQSDFTHHIDAAQAEMQRRRLAFQAEELNEKVQKMSDGVDAAIKLRTRLRKFPWKYYFGGKKYKKLFGKIPQK